MTDSSAPGPEARDTGGIPAAFLRLFGSITRHLQSLVALAGLEGREAAALYLRVALALAVALFFAAFGYIFVLLFVAFALEKLFQIEWLWIALGLAAVHLLGALIGGLYVKKTVRTPIFRATAEEIRKDAAALRGSINPPTP